MNKVTINLACRHHPEGHDVDSWTTVAPGLVVHPPMVCPDGGGDQDWCVTHARSGGAVCRVSGPEEGQYVADLLAACGHWDRPAAEIAKDKRMRQLATLIQQQWPPGGGPEIKGRPERMAA
jgi:hypothetical protein